MSYDTNQHHRRSIRLPGYDYAQPGEYFVTICTQQHEGPFGQIMTDEFVPNEAGDMVATWWKELPRKFPSTSADAFVVMPNHVHGIVVIGHTGRAGHDRGAHMGRGGHAGEGGHDRGAHTGAPLRLDQRVTLGRIVQWFKTMTTNEYIRGVSERGWTPFIERLWQRNFFEHIVRDEDDLNRVRDYITSNPRTWKDDPDNPAVANSATS